MKQIKNAYPKLMDNYTHDEAKAVIDGMLAEQSPDSKLTFLDSIAHINKSYLIRSPELRLAVCAVLSRCAPIRRSAASLAAEWRVHNVAYKLHVLRSAAGDVDLDFNGDSRWPVAAASKLFELLRLF